ncbi:MAG: ABC transporter substrate-binding protein, partial [Candidatus Cryptobacteroides sp.]
VLTLAGCTVKRSGTVSLEEHVPDYLVIDEDPEGRTRVISLSPFGLKPDTLILSGPLQRLVLMSTTYVGFLDAIGCDSVIAAVSGLKYVCSPELQKAAQEGKVKETGYDAAPDYEAILSANPDLVLTYSVSGEESRFVKKLESLGIRVFTVHEHLERYPLARASYVRLFGALTGRMDRADSVFTMVRKNYESLSSGAEGRRRKVLMNIPYSDQWFIPGEDNYMTHLVMDAGGTVLGAGKGRRESSVISLEEAYSLSAEADLWLNVGWCSTVSQLERENPVFGDFYEAIARNAALLGLGDSEPVWNCNLRLTPSGGNDFWESGAVRPDLVLSDLVGIFNGDGGEKYYYRPVRK